MKITNTLARLSDDELLRRLSAVLQDSRRTEAELIAHIAEVDARRLFAREATPSMFAYCTERLHLSEDQAYLRIRVARAAREHPPLLQMLAEGHIHLSGIGKLVPHLTSQNREALLERSTHRSKREIEELVAELQPQPDVPSAIRKLPTRPVPQPGPDPARPPLALLGPDPVEPPVATPARRAEVRPLAPERYKVQFTASAELRDKLTRLQALMHASVPDGDLAAIIEQAVTEKLERLEAKRFGKTKKPRKTLAQTATRAVSRNIPAAVRRSVHARDGGRCTFLDGCGRRCTDRRHLEFHHHDVPYGRGGDHSPGNIRLMCRAHNALLAEREYGKEWMGQFRGVARVRPT